MTARQVRDVLCRLNFLERADLVRLKVIGKASTEWERFRADPVRHLLEADDDAFDRVCREILAPQTARPTAIPVSAG